jgi:hypothetical protein
MTTAVRSGMSGAGGGGSAGLPNPAMASGTAGAGGFKTRSDLDPNARFAWPENVPGSAATDCQPGVYSGTFQCDFTPDPSLGSAFAVDVSGPISLTLTRSMNGEFLEIANGSLDAVAQVFFGIHAELNGRLDCKTLRLTAMTVNGVFAFGDPTMGTPAGDLAANLTGMLEPKAGALSGEWEILSGTVPGSCTGTWTTMLGP